MRCLTPLLQATVAGLAVAWPLSGLAHTTGEGEPHHWWTLDPWVVIPLLASATLYSAGFLILRRRHYSGWAARTSALSSALTGTAALFLALIWPLDAFAELSFAAHMGQHMLLIAVAAPLLAFARVSVPITAAVSAVSVTAAIALSRPAKWLRLLMQPSVAFVLHGAVIWVWHAPLLFELALQRQWVHTLEHLSFLLAGYWYWSVLLRDEHAQGEGYGAAALWSLSTLMHTGLLGALITFAPRPLYPSYLTTQGSVAAALQDQQLAGLLMWIPMGACYLIGGLAFAAAWMRRTQRFGDRQKG